MGSASPPEISLGRDVRHTGGVFSVFVGDSNLRETDRHGQLVAGSGNPSDGVQGWQATDRVHMSDGGKYP